MWAGFNSGDASNIEHYWGISSGFAEVRVNGVWKYDTPVTVNDRLKVAIAAGAIKFYKNDVLIYTSDVAPAYPLNAYWWSGTDGAGLTSAFSGPN